MSRFHYSTLSAHVALKASDITYAQAMLNRPDAKKQSREEIESAIKLVAQHEHEFFHCRATLSTTFGWLLFYTARAIRSYQTDMVTASRGAIQSGQLDQNALSSKARFAQTGLITADTVWRFLNSPSPYWAERLRPLGVLSPISISLPFATHYMCLMHVRPPTDDELRYHDVIPSLPHMLEAHAVWREFFYISYYARHLMPSEGKVTERLTPFNEFTRQALGPVLQNLRYRRVADLIGQFTGHGLAKTVVGYLLDIALCPPMGGEDFSISWKEFHPCARLLEILRIWHSLSLPDWTNNFNLQPLPREAYEEIDTAIAKKLGWSTALANVRALEKSLLENQPSGGTSESLPPRFMVAGQFNPAACARALLENRFMKCFQWKLASGAAFIDPDGPEKLIYVTQQVSQPAITAWEDDFWAPNFFGDPFWEQILIEDTLLSLFLEEFVKVESEHKFELARRFHARATEWLKSNPDHTNRLETTFDEYVRMILDGAKASIDFL
jgi:hypothetical protein